MAVDLLTFPFISGRHALDFVGTVGKRGSADIERLQTADDLARWSEEAGLGRSIADDADLEAARRLREALYSLVLSTLGDDPARPVDVAVVNEFASVETAAPSLGLRSGTIYRKDSAAPASAVLAVVARDGIDLLTGPDAALIRDCEDPTCTLLFVDTSRSHRRRWCSMNRCGARAKMRTLRST
ncbi:CGNR zinc finger domain-containing protein [Kribbella sancticallisti]|uniref:CGNR zinc finger domain-containing protein n=1 Tax=Kribbella sancticallisti TaxID=460087 RepID=UPI0031E1FB71